MKSFRIAGALVCGAFALGCWFFGYTSAGAGFLAMTVLLALNARRPPGAD
jgi:hypothetical protein